MGTETPKYESPFPPRRVPPPGIIHLLLWTLFSAVYLALIRNTLGGEEDQIAEGWATTHRVSSVLQSMIAGATVTGALVLVQQRLAAGPPLVWHPGHWLLMIEATGTVIALSLYAIARSVDFDEAIWAGYFVICLACAMVYSFIAGQKQRSNRWKFLFATLGGLYTVEALCNPLGTLPNGVRVILIPMVIVVCRLDQVAKQRRDWLHWLGVTSLTADSIVILGQTIWLWIIWK